jgi:hypothetical protein
VELGAGQHPVDGAEIDVDLGRYYVDYSPDRTPAHYNAFRRLDVPGLRTQYEQLRAMSRAEAAAGSPLMAGPGVVPLPRFFALARSGGPSVAEAVNGLNEQGYWPARLGSTSHPFTRHGSKEIAAGDFSQTHAGDETDTSPFPDGTTVGISTAAYIRHMSVLIRALEDRR